MNEQEFRRKKDIMFSLLSRLDHNINKRAYKMKDECVVDLINSELLKLVNITEIKL